MAKMALQQSPPPHENEPFALFFARLESYKGVDIFIEAMHQLEDVTGFRAIIAGKGELDNVVTSHVPHNVEIRNRLLGDEEAIDLFQRCSLVVLPYRDATQSAIIAAAYFFGKPVIVTRTGALPEYVIEGETGWVIAPGNSATLAEHLRAALAAPERLAAMGEAGRAWYQAQRQIALNTLSTMYRQASINK
jgi:glycosyltransferase involved in cell wall biosynthesis